MPINVISDFSYVVHSTQLIENSQLRFHTDEQLMTLFTQLQTAVRSRMHPFYITHIRAHTPLPGPLTEGNHMTDHLVVTAISNARHFHNLTHVNASGLKRRYTITQKEAKAISNDAQLAKWCIPHLLQEELILEDWNLITFSK